MSKRCPVPFSNFLATDSTHVSSPKGTPRLALQSSCRRSAGLKSIDPSVGARHTPVLKSPNSSNWNTKTLPRETRKLQDDEQQSYNGTEFGGLRSQSHDFALSFSISGSCDLSETTVFLSLLIHPDAVDRCTPIRVAWLASPVSCTKLRSRWSYARWTRLD